MNSIFQEIPQNWNLPPKNIKKQKNIEKTKKKQKKQKTHGGGKGRENGGKGWENGGKNRTSKWAFFKLFQIIS